jgi:hypothetical protein
MTRRMSHNLLKVCQLSGRTLGDSEDSHSNVNGRTVLDDSDDVEHSNGHRMTESECFERDVTIGWKQGLTGVTA